MLRIWFKLWQNGRMKESLTIESNTASSVTASSVDASSVTSGSDGVFRRVDSAQAPTEFDKLFASVDSALEEAVRAMDLAKPIWFPMNKNDLARFGRTKFTQDHFVEAFPYQSLEIEIIETDEDKHE